MRRILLLVSVLVLGVGATGLEREVDANQGSGWKVEHWYNDASGQNIGYLTQACNGELLSWGTSAGAVTHQTTAHPCTPTPICDTEGGYSWYSLDGVGSYCLRDELVPDLQAAGCSVAEH